MSLMLALSAVLMFAHASPSGAQPGPRDPSSRFRPNWVDARVNVRKALAKFAACAVEGQPKLTREMLLRSSYELDRKDYNLFTSDCMPDEIISDDGAMLQMTATVARFSFADTLFARELANSDPSRLAAAPALPVINMDEKRVMKARAQVRERELAKFDEGTARARRDIAYYRFGECVVRQDAAAAKNFLLTKIETAEESQAFAQLSPALNRCQGTDQHYSTNLVDVRGTVAFNYVRLAYAATGAAQ